MLSWLGENRDNVDIAIRSLHRYLGDTDIASFQYRGITIILWNRTALTSTHFSYGTARKITFEAYVYSIRIV